MSLKEALQDELKGGDFIAQMSSTEFLLFQKVLSKRAVLKTKKSVLYK